MDRFGEEWISHPQKIKQAWLTLVKPNDIMLIPGDISWARKPAQAKADLEWLHHLPGTKIILRGNHDFWWESPSKMKSLLPPSIHAIQNNAIEVGDFVFFGSRLWDTQEYSTLNFVSWDPRKGDIPTPLSQAELNEQESIYDREIERLQISIKCLEQYPSKIRIGLCHYPPYGQTFSKTRATKLFAEAGAKAVVYGHLHSLKTDIQIDHKDDGVDYHLTSCDFLKYIPKKIFSL